jgi:hypothetical protein
MPTNTAPNGYSIIEVADDKYLVPTAMYNAVVGDAIAAGFVNPTAAEALSYELLEWETGGYANSLDTDEWTDFLTIAELI